jgi:uncharacterized protein
MTVTTLARRAAMLAFALAWLAGAAPALAQQPSPSAIATAKELLQVKGATTMFDPIIPGIIENTKNLILPSNPGLFKDVSEVATKLRNELTPRRTEVVDRIARFYALKFTEAEMKEVIAFYKSPVGKKFVTEEPPVIDQGLQSAEEWTRQMADEVMNKFRAEMKKKGHDL